MKTYNEFIRLSANMVDSNYDSTRFDRLMECSGGQFDGVIVSRSKISSIINFFESTNDYNRFKVSDLINNNINNINKVHNLVLDYEKNKQKG